MFDCNEFTIGGVILRKKTIREDGGLQLTNFSCQNFVPADVPFLDQLVEGSLPVLLLMDDQKLLTRIKLPNRNLL